MIIKIALVILGFILGELISVFIISLYMSARDKDLIDDQPNSKVD